jgi:fucose 4-O-acetylase-like acetyltransferase
MTRQCWIDALKGMGIITVVVAHVTYNRLLMELIFMFHMPLFFFLGGWLHNTGVAPAQYLKTKALGLLVPYLGFLVLLWPLELLVSYPDQAWNSAWLWNHLLTPMLLGGPLLTGFASVFWFVTCYFLTQQLMHCLLRRHTVRGCTLICLAMLVLAYLHAWLLPQWWLPWNAATVLIAAPIYLIGYRARTLDGLSLAALALAAIVALAAVALNIGGVHNTLDLKNVAYGMPIVTLASSLACIALMAALALRLQTNLVGRALAALGGASMTIMFLHQFVQLMMAKKFGIEQALPRIAAALMLCYLAHGLLKKSPLMARFFLGIWPRARPGALPEKIQG